jgi:glycosyltransferase involved in cell wall biosynthesis
MTPEQRAHFESLSGYPEGGEAGWRARYEPLIARAVERERPAAPRLSVVVVAWRSADFVVECVDHVLAQRGLSPGELEVVLVDNGGLEAAHAALSERVHLHLHMVDNVGLSIARNAGAAWARGPLIAYIDDDGLIAPDYCARGLAYFDDPQVAAVRSKIVAKEHPLFTTLAGHYDRGPVAVEDCLVTEGSMLTRRDLYIRLGGFAESLYGHEGIDLTFRIKSDDPAWRVLYVPDVIMAHDYCDGWPKFFKKNFRYSGIDDRVAARDPELEAFMQEYFARRFERDPLPTGRRLARLGLIAVRGALRLGARARASLQG